ncbi:MAG: TlpA family protein disulfide reductase [SAR202 cluster bacterium]|nr:TlpA family protein disulfide reductase [SAR202 cluster bacterium]|tara:strand:+ start:49349 stop:49981 length:633 start_codon:yes stop_codon:yes gene_type:complete
MNNKYYKFNFVVIYILFVISSITCTTRTQVNTNPTTPSGQNEKNSIKIQNTPSKKNVSEKFTILKKSTLIGSRSNANDTLIPLLDSGNIKISDFENSIVVLNFWASWCGPCRWEMPFFEDIHQKFKNKNVTVIGISVSDPIPTAKAFAKQTNVSYTLASDSEGKITREYNVLQLPTTFILNQKGEVMREIRNVANKGVLTIFLNGVIERD